MVALIIPAAWWIGQGENIMQQSGLQLHDWHSCGVHPLDPIPVYCFARQATADCPILRAAFAAAPHLPSRCDTGSLEMHLHWRILRQALPLTRWCVRVSAPAYRMGTARTASM